MYFPESYIFPDNLNKHILATERSPLPPINEMYYPTTNTRQSYFDVTTILYFLPSRAINSLIST